jgi:hypothetical protein
MTTKQDAGKHIRLRLDADADLIVQQKQLEVLKAKGKKPTKQEAILILIKQ